MEFRSEPPERHVIPIEESLGHWLTRIENESRRETPQQTRQRERNQELRDLKRSLKKDGRFVDMVHNLRRTRPRRRRKALEEFCEMIYEDPMAQARGQVGMSLSWKRLIGTNIHHVRLSGFMLFCPRPGTRSLRCNVPGSPSPNYLTSSGIVRTWTRLRNWSAGVARSQVQVIRRLLEYWQCPTLSRRNSTSLVLLGIYDL
jgi:hypothetical protein